MSIVEQFFRLEVGDGVTDLLADAYAITVHRGLDLDGVTDEPAPASFTAVIKGSEAAHPLTNDDVRPERPVRLLAGIEDTYGTDVTWHEIFTGTILRGRIEHTSDAKHDPDSYRVTITATDLTPRLAAQPCEVAVSGNLTQRVDAVLDGTGIPYHVTDLGDPTGSVPLITGGKTALAQLRLIRDTLHAAMFVDKAGVLQLVDDSARSRVVLTPDHVATDDDLGEPGIYYHDLVPVFDTDAVVNVLTIETLAEPENIEVTYTDEDSRAEWGPHPQTVTVNDGLAETHAGLYLATRTEPALVPDRLAFVVDTTTDTYATHLSAACTVEIGDSIAVTRLGVTHTLAVRELTHTLATVLDPLPRVQWTVDVGLRVPDVLATRWDDVPADVTWADVPAGLTWDEAVNWHPYREGA